MRAYWKIVWILFGLFVVVNFAYLHRVPGLMGDEASEGENVYELLRSEKVVVQGERSYIGPLIDYMRVPFIAVFGYTPLVLRLIVVLAACVTFWMAASVLLKFFGETPALFALALGFFNPIYLTQARLAWAISLFPFFFFLTLYLLQKPRWAIWAGLAAGIGLSNHILFLPTLIAIIVVGIVSVSLRGRWRELLAYWPAVTGFVAGFALQFLVMLNFREDQGDVAAVAQNVWERAHDLPKLLPLALSGSSYVASYTAVEFSFLWQWAISIVIILLVLTALFFGKPKKIAWLWFLGLVIQTIVLLYMIDRFSLRYFTAPVIGRWILAGVGLGALVSMISSFARSHTNSGDLARGAGINTISPAKQDEQRMKIRSQNFAWLWAIAVALGLVVWSAFVVLIPFLKTGGSTGEFSLGNRTDSAAALVDTRSLVECLSGAGKVSSENVHIWNRLQFWSHQVGEFTVLPGDDSGHADWLVQYRNDEQPEAGGRCPELAHFQVVAN